MHRACAYKGSKLGPEKQACQNPKVGSGTGPAVMLYRSRSKCNTRGKCSICSDTKYNTNDLKGINNHKPPKLVLGIMLAYPYIYSYN